MSVLAEATYITGTSVDRERSRRARPDTRPRPTSTRTLTVDLAAPTAPSYTAPSTLQVGEAITALSPSGGSDIGAYGATGLPLGLAIHASTGVISGTPTTADANTASATVTVTDAAGNPATVDIVFPLVAKGDQTLTGFRYSAETVTFGSPAPAVTAPTGAQTTVTYTATPSNVCTVNESTGALTLPGVGACVITATAASSNNYNEATATFTVTVQATPPPPSPSPSPSPPPPPSVSYTAPSSLQVGVAVSAVTPTTSDSDIASYSATGLPSGLAIHASTGVISGTPTTADANTASATVTVTDTAGNPATVDIVFPMVAKGDQTLTGFRYSAETVTFGSPAPAVTAPTGAQTTVTYTATPSNVCTVNESTGALTLPGVGACVITATAASSNNYNEATAMFTVTVQPAGTLSLTLDAIATDNTVNIAEKTAGFAISGATGSEAGVSVTVTVGTTELTATSDSNGAWTVSVLAEATYITGTSVAVSVTASKAGYTAPTDVERSLTVDLAAPTAPTYTAPGSLKVGEAIAALSPSGGSDIDAYGATGLPSGLAIHASTGVISGTPDTANASTQQATVTVSDSADNTATTSITFPAVAEGDQTESPDTGDEAPPNEREALLALYHATEGENWEYRDKWNTDEPVGTWHGVTVDSEGRVIELDLAANGLSGEVPPSLVENLPNLRRLYLNDNRLSAVPLAQLRDLLEGPDPALEELALWGNDLLGGTGGISVELDRRVERAALRALYERTGGPRWKDSDNWLDETDPFSFSEWYEVMTDDDGRVMELDLSANGLSGELGGELETLSALYSLDLSGNPDLEGELPKGLMELTELFVVNIEDTGMCAPGDAEFNQWLEGISFDGEICAEGGDDSLDTGMDTQEPDAGGGGCTVASDSSTGDRLGSELFNSLLIVLSLLAVSRWRRSGVGQT